MASNSAPITHFEIYVLIRKNWSLQVRYRHDQKEEALAEAKKLEQSLGVQVKVVRETYFPDTNTCDELTAYISPKQPKTEPAFVAPRPRPRPTERPAPRQVEPRRRKPVDAPPPSRQGTGMMVLNLLIVIIIAITIAAVASGSLPYVVAWAGQMGHFIGPDAYSRLVFATFAGTFLLVAVPATLMVLEGSHMRWLGRLSRRAESQPNAAVAAAARPESEAAAPAGAFHRAATEVLSEVLANAADRLLGAHEAPAGASSDAAPPQPEPPKPQPPEAEPATPEPTKPEAATAQTPSDGATEPAAEVVAPPGLERHRMTAMRFLGDAIVKIKETRPQLDSFNRFGVNLLLAGAVDGLGESAGLGPESRRGLLLEMIEMVGGKGPMAQAFCGKLEEYVLETRYLQMMRHGRDAMERFIASDPAAVRGLGDAIEAWNKPTAKQAPPRVTAVMFTDMVGSTDITQAQGDLAAQELVRRHNGIVRNALAEFDGREIKHTGDGIMASFASTANAVDAAVAIQRAVATYNDGRPTVPVQLRIGINAGEPIEEEDDLFGTTVQLAARLCAAAEPGQVLCSNVVRELSAGKGRRFLSQGEHPLKGFREPVTLHEVIWQPAAEPAPALELASGLTEEARPSIEATT